MLPSQHDILHATLHDGVNHNAAAAAQSNRMDGRDIPRQVPPPPPSSTLPFTTTTTTAAPADDQQPPGSQAPTSPRPKRRGRKPKNYNLSSSSSSTPGDGTTTTAATTTGEADLDGDGLPKDAQRRRVLERNRIAATKCRVRKRDEAEALAVREKDMYDQNRQLATCFDSLAAEVYHLKTQLLRHTDCDCVLIQRYIANEARRSVDGMASPSQQCGGGGGGGRGGHMPPVPVLTPVGGGGGGSPYHYGRLGSSTGSSSVDSASIRGPDDDIPGHGPILWTNPFPPAVAASTSNPQIPPMPMSHPHLEPSPSDPMAPANVMPMTPVDVAAYAENLCIGVGPQAQRVGDVGWDYHWNFQ